MIWIEVTYTIKEFKSSLDYLILNYFYRIVSWPHPNCQKKINWGKSYLECCTSCYIPTSRVHLFSIWQTKGIQDRESENAWTHSILLSKQLMLVERIIVSWCRVAKSINVKKAKIRPLVVLKSQIFKNEKRPIFSKNLLK